MHVVLVYMELNISKYYPFRLYKWSYNVQCIKLQLARMKFA